MVCHKEAFGIVCYYLLSYSQFTRLSMKNIFQLIQSSISFVISHLFLDVSPSSCLIKVSAGLSFLRLPCDGSQKIRSWANSLLLQQCPAIDILCCLIVSVSFGFTYNPLFVLRSYQLILKVGLRNVVYATPNFLYISEVNVQLSEP